MDLKTRQEVLTRLAQRTLGSERYLDDAIDELTQTGAEAIGVERCSLWLLDDNDTQLHCIDLYEHSKREHSSGVVLAAASYPAYFAALASGRAIDAHDARTDPRTTEFAEGYLVPLGITSMLDATVRRDGAVIGVLCCEHVGPVRKWTAEEGMFAAAFADQAALLLAAGERKRLQESLAASEERYRKLMDAANDAIAITDDAGVIAEANHKLEQLLGVSPEAIIGKSLVDFVAIEDRELFRDVLSILRADTRVRGTFRLTAADGRTFGVELSAASVPFGATRQTIAVIRDQIEAARSSRPRL